MNMDLSHAIRFNFGSHKLFPKASGCYVVTKGEQILYIGLTNSFHGRWGKHHKYDELDFHGAEFVYLFEFPEERIESIEAIWIAVYNPLLNNGVSDAYWSATHQQEASELSIVPLVEVTKKDGKYWFESDPTFIPFPDDLSDLTPDDFAQHFTGDHVSVARDLIAMIRNSSHSSNGTHE
jgi:hypothetical protein